MRQLTGIDLFAGAGGFTTGAKSAGVKVIWAANHWIPAVNTHSRNHPETAHACQDLRQADWRAVPDHDILLASPECRGHTKAKGKERKHHDASRSTAWAVVDAVEVKQPPFLVVENVPEFRRWRHYGRWKDCLAEDYRLTENVLDAADFGVPQNRVRMFLVGVHKRVSKFPVAVTAKRLPHTPARNVIDWDGGEWTRVRTADRSPNTLARVEAGRRQFPRQPFLIAYYGNAKGGRSLDRPLGTVTTKDRYALVDGAWMRMLTKEEYKRAMAFPDWYVLPSEHTVSVKLLGNAVCPPVATFLLNQIKRAVPMTSLAA